MFWNYRMIRVVTPYEGGDDVVFRLAEVYYDRDGEKPEGFAWADSVMVSGDATTTMLAPAALAAMREELERLSGALSRPILALAENDRLVVWDGEA